MQLKISYKQDFYLAVFNLCENKNIKIRKKKKARCVFFKVINLGKFYGFSEC